MASDQTAAARHASGLAYAGMVAGSSVAPASIHFGPASRHCRTDYIRGWKP